MAAPPLAWTSPPERNDDRFRILAESMPQFVWISDTEGNVEYVNSRWTAYTGQTVEQTAAQMAEVIHEDDAAEMWERWREARSAETDYEVEFRCRGIADGSYRWFLARGLPVRDEQGRIVRWIGTSTDIEEQKRAEAQAASVNERLYRAVYESTHRIKNQLQILAATVDMALMEGEESISASEFVRLGAQIRTISILQDILTVNWRANAESDAERVSSRAMLERVVQMLTQAVGGGTVAIEIADTQLPVKTVTTLALITNETVTNALKHGMGEVAVTFSVVRGRGVLEVCDNGPGFAEGFDPRTSANTGIELISSLTSHDLRGTVRYENRPEGGAKVVVSFPLPA